MIIHNNLSSVVKSIGRNNATSTKKIQVGRVYGIVTTEGTPTKAMFEKAGGYSGIGTVFYLDYDQAKDVPGTIDDNFLSTCKIAKPRNPQDQYYPVKGELIFLEEGPSPLSQESGTASQKYYSLINLWNNQQQNSQPALNSDSLGATFTENPNVRPLIPYEGDNILGGRQGSSLRFTSTTRGVTPSNEWSEIGGEYDPITILTNGLDYDPNKNYYVEQINKDASSIYLTSLQKIPLQTDKIGVLNNLTNPLNIPDYTYAQTILNSDRVVLNSKKDEVMIFAKTNIELNTKNIINLNADERVHLNANAVFLGPYDSNNIPQPVLLGYDTMKVFEQLQETLTRLAFYLSSAVSAPEGSPIISLNNAGNELLSDMKKVCDLLENTTSKKVFTS
jgi:hypothetical protein